MNIEAVSQFVAEVYAREDADQLYFRVRAGVKTASLTTIETDIAIGDTIDVSMSAIEDAISKAATDPSHKIAYVEAVTRGTSAVVKRLPVRLDEDDGTLNLVPAKGTDAAGVLAIQLVRSSEAWERGFQNLLRQHFELQKKYAELVATMTEMVTDAKVRAEVENDTSNQKLVNDMIRGLAPGLNLALAKAFKATPEEAQAVAEAAGKAAEAAAKAEAGPVGPVEAPEDMTAEQAGPIVDSALDAFERVLQKHPSAILDVNRLLRLQTIGKAVQAMMGGAQ